jgi:hypothetical protein
MATAIDLLPHTNVLATIEYVCEQQTRRRRWKRSFAHGGRRRRWRKLG